MKKSLALLGVGIIAATSIVDFYMYRANKLNDKIFNQQIDRFYSIVDFYDSSLESDTISLDDLLIAKDNIESFDVFYSGNLSNLSDRLLIFKENNKDFTLPEMKMYFAEDKKTLNDAFDSEISTYGAKEQRLLFSGLLVSLIGLFAGSYNIRKSFE